MDTYYFNTAGEQASFTLPATDFSNGYFLTFFNSIYPWFRNPHKLTFTFTIKTGFFHKDTTRKPLTETLNPFRKRASVDGRMAEEDIDIDIDIDGDEPDDQLRTTNSANTANGKQFINTSETPRIDNSSQSQKGDTDGGSVPPGSGALASSVVSIE